MKKFLLTLLLTTFFSLFGKNNEYDSILKNQRYLENVIRDNFDFTGTPMVLQFKNRGSKDEIEEDEE